MRNEAAHRVAHAEYVDAEQPFDVLPIGLVKFRDRLHAGNIAQDVSRTECVDCLFGQSLDIDRVGDIAAHTNGFAAGCANFFRYLFGSCVIQIGDDQSCAFPRESPCEAAADAAGAAGYDDDPVFELTVDGATSCRYREATGRLTAGCCR